MKPERMTEELARIDGLDLYRGKAYRHKPNGALLWCGEVPDYLHPTEGFNHLHQIIGEMDDRQIQDYDIALCLIIKRDTGTILNTTHKSSIAQMAEAILRAYGKFDEEEG